MEDLKKFAPKFKSIIHYPEIRDEDGEKTGEIDTNLDPMLYLNMIQNGPEHAEEPNKVWTQYKDEKVLSKTNALKIKEGKMNEKDFLLNVQDIFKSKHSMTLRIMGVVADIFCSDTTLKVRMSMTAAFVQSFEAGESRNTKQAREDLEELGEEIEDGPSMSIPAARDEDKKNDEDVSEGKIDEVDNDEFVVHIDQ
tara:strand:+ start:33 stop:617 length:585 start_codon:yes stop_codon:yes gene_type:complete